MNQKMIINVDSPTRLSNLRDGDIIVYDGTRKVFYVTTKQNLFLHEEKARQEYQQYIDKQLAEMKQITEEHKAFVVESMNELKAEIKNLKENYNDFLIKYKNTNEKIIEMVESVVNG